MSALAEHWEQIIKERLVELAMTKGLNDDITKRIARADLVTLGILLDHVRQEAWQDGHDTALMHGQSSNPYRK